MAAGGEQGGAGCGAGSAGEDLYAVLGLKKECSAADLKTAYKKLAMRWHPDRCSSSGSSKTVDEAKNKFQEIQEAYSVLSDTDKRFLYDVGIYDDGGDDASGMGEFLGEMAAMMSQAKPGEGQSETTFQELQELFVEMFQGDMDAFCGGGTTEGGAFGSSRRPVDASICRDLPSMWSTTPFPTATPAAVLYSGCSLAGGGGGGGLKRDGADMCSDKAKAASPFDAVRPGQGGTFCFGVHEGNWPSSATARGRMGGGGGGGKRRGVRKPREPSAHAGGGEAPAE